jgi:endonuclease/exonuclease/phosphatase family metal-dependent hydrolase
VLRLATFNLKDLFLPDVRAADQAFEAKLFADKTRYVADRLLRAQADVVALQEVGEPAALDAVLALVPGYAAVVGTPDDRGIRCAVLSRRPIVRSAVHTTSALPFPVFVEGDPPPYGTALPLRRGIVEVVVTHEPFGDVHVFCIHMKSNLPRKLRKPTGEDVPLAGSFQRAEATVRSTVIRAAEALYLRRLADEAASPHVCVMGDLNDDRRSLSLRILYGDRETDRVLLSAIERVPEHKRWTTLHGGRPSQIDHVLLTPGLHGAIVRADVLNEDLRDHGPPVKDAPRTPDSDHALYWVDLGEPSPPSSEG